MAYGNLVLFSMHMALCPAGKSYVEANGTMPRPLVIYHLKQLRSYALASTVEDFRAGETAFRYLREVALEVRNEVIETAITRPVAAEHAPCSSEPLHLTILQQGEVSDAHQADNANSSAGRS